MGTLCGYSEDDSALENGSLGQKQCTLIEASFDSKNILAGCLSLH